MIVEAERAPAERIERAFARKVRALRRRPAAGRGTARTRVTARDGLRCEVQDGPWRLAVDMAIAAGGSGSAPNPGVLGRGALGACLAIGYVTWAAHLHVPIEMVQVDVEADYDASAHYGVAGGPPGYSCVRYAVTIRSEASPADVMRLIEAADAHASYLDIFRRAIPVERTVRVDPGGAP